jgi:hypothetical protein
MSSHREMGERGKGPASALGAEAKPEHRAEPFILKVPNSFRGRVTLIVEPEPDPLPPTPAEPQGEIGQ